MKDLNDQIFIQLFKETCQKCFGYPLAASLSETDSRLLANTILQQTGLVIGVKSIKNYSNFIFNSAEGKRENPSVATLDTLARYVLNAPETDEIKRKKQESHHPYWFQYRSQFVNSQSTQKKTVNRKKIILFVVPALIIVIGFFLLKNIRLGKEQAYMTDEFDDVSVDSLHFRGWVLKNEAPLFWSKRNTIPGHLSLYTLIGDNWVNTNNTRPAGIKNLMIRKVDIDCFTTEIHLTDFIPYESWQQAGILLSEDSTFNGKALRLSLGYNNFFGGYTKPAEIIIQAVGASVDGNISRPEEIAHVALFSGEPRKDSLIMNNLSKAALKIEKKGSRFRFLYSTGSMESFAFKEAAHGDFTIKPKYIGIFAMQGLAATENPVPVKFDSFSLIGLDCNY
jgi:hypothetical protein